MTVINDFSEILDSLAAAATQGKLEEVAAEKLTATKRRVLTRFLGSVKNAEKEDLAPLEAAFDRFIVSLPDKITPVLFETVLKIGIHIKAESESQFWFSLITTFDYGLNFDRFDVLKILATEVLKDAENSWKAACLLCILVQDYPSLVVATKNQLLSVVKDLKKLLSNSTRYTLICYLVELVSQINDEALTSQFTLGCPMDLPKKCFSNDAECQVFVQASAKCVSSIATIESFTIDSIIAEKPGVCELSEYSLTALIQTNDYVSPIEINFQDINDLERDDTNLKLTLLNPPKHALASKFELQDSSPLLIRFSRNDYFNSFIDKLIEECDIKERESPTRKISVVETFIKLNGFEEDDGGDEERNGGGEDVQLPDFPLEDEVIQDTIGVPHEEVPPSSNDQSIYNITEPSDFVESIGETQRSIGNNTTKDTSVFIHKQPRPISKIVAESTRDNIFGNKESMDPKPPSTSSFAPDTLETALNVIAHKSNSRFTDLRSSSLPPLELDRDVKEKSPLRGSSADPWGFISDEELQTISNIKTRSKAMKVFAGSTKKAEQIKKAKPEESYQKAKKLNLEKSNTSKLANTSRIANNSKQGSPSSQPSPGALHDASLSGLTSPIIHAQRRAATRAQSIVPTEQPAPPAALVANTQNADIEEDKARGRKRRSGTAVDGDYNPTPVQTKEFQEPPRKKVAANVSERTKRSMNRCKKQQKVTKKADSLTQIFNNPPNKGSEKEDTKNPSAKVLKANVVSKEQTSVIEPPKKNGTRSKSPVQARASEQEKNVSKLPHQQRPILQEESTSKTPTVSYPMADSLLSEAYTNTLQKQIFESITSFSNQLVKKIHIINEEINKKVMDDLTTKYETLFNDLRINFSKDVDEMCDFISDVKGLLNLPENELVDYIKSKKLGHKV